MTGSSSLSVFGFSGSVDGYPFAVCMSIILTFVVSAQAALSYLDKAVAKTAFRGAVQSLYKDLVIMGLVSFILTLLSSGGIQFLGPFLVYFQIADVTLFISTIFHVLFCIALIMANDHHMQRLRGDLAKDMHLLVKEYRDEVQNGFLAQWSPFSKLRRQIELRVLRITFLSNFNLSRSFDFGRYITIAEENNIIEMMEASPMQWAVFGFALAAVCVGFTLEDTGRYDSQIRKECSHFSDPHDVTTVSAFTTRFYCMCEYNFRSHLVFVFYSASTLGINASCSPAAPG